MEQRRHELLEYFQHPPVFYLLAALHNPSVKDSGGLACIGLIWSGGDIDSQHPLVFYLLAALHNLLHEGFRWSSKHRSDLGYLSSNVNDDSYPFGRFHVCPLSNR
jgi:hypothetical protein